MGFFLLLEFVADNFEFLVVALDFRGMAFSFFNEEGIFGVVGIEEFTVAGIPDAVE